LLTNLRDWVRSLDGLCNGLIHLVMRMLEHHPEHLAEFAPMAPILLSFLASLRPSRILQHPGHQLTAFAFFLVRPQNATDDARPLGAAARASLGAALAWMAETLDELLLVGDDTEAFSSIVRESTLAEETKTFLLTAASAKT